MTNIATPLHRILASVIDCILMIIPTTLGILFISGATSPTTLLNHLLSFLVFVVVFWPASTFLYCFLTSHYGGSPGKLLTGIAIVNSKNKYISFWLAFFRSYVGYFVSGTLFFLGFAWILIDKQRRAWHDLISDTYVIKTHSTGLLTGFLALVAIILLNVWLVGQSLSNFSRHKSVYINLYDSIKSDFPSPTTPFLFRENSFQEPI